MVILVALIAIACGIAAVLVVSRRLDPLRLPPGASEAELIVAVERWLEAQYAKGRFNGGLLVIHEGEVRLSRALGFTDHRASEPLTDHSAFPLASLSKQFTAAAILRLASTQRLHLDDAVAGHLGGFPHQEVTIRHLLNHTSGIPDEYMQLARRHRASLGDVLRIADVVQLVARHSPARHVPGTIMQYSNTNYVLLAGIVETVYGASFEQFMSDELFRPLGMRDSRVWTLCSAQRAPNQVRDFDQVLTTRSAVDPTWLDGVAGDGAVFCSLHDWAIWDAFWYGNPLIDDALLQEAFTCPRLRNGATSSYGFGWVLENGRHWHNGSWHGANTFVARYPERRSCVVVLDNSSNLRLDRIARQIEHVLGPILRHGAVMLMTLSTYYAT